MVDYEHKVLEVKHLKKYFFVGKGKNALVVPAVDDISFDVYKREVFGLVGESGCGKPPPPGPSLNYTILPKVPSIKRYPNRGRLPKLQKRIKNG